jgi:hypothetical protein
MANSAFDLPAPGLVDEGEGPQHQPGASEFDDADLAEESAAHGSHVWCIR